MIATLSWQAVVLIVAGTLAALYLGYALLFVLVFRKIFKEFK